MSRFSWAVLWVAIVAAPALAQGPFSEREKTAPQPIKTKIAELRKAAATNQWSFNIAYTAAADRPMSHLAGTDLPDDIKKIGEEVHRVGHKLLDLEHKAGDAFLLKHPGKKLHGREIEPRKHPEKFAHHKSFDWRAYNKVTPVTDQRSCGSCWAFASIAAFESSYAIHNNSVIKASEQDILDHSNGGSCTGGRWWEVFEYLIKHGTTSEKDYPYLAAKSNHAKGPGAYRAVAWGFVTHTALTPTVDMTKEALCRHGPLTVGVHATNAFQYYGGGVFNEHAEGRINHGVTIIGWDDAKGKKGAWLIKNSWGKSWGENGLMWIEYHANHIGSHAAWVEARTTQY
jgi:cathepsin L